MTLIKKGFDRKVLLSQCEEKLYFSASLSDIQLTYPYVNKISVTQKQSDGWYLGHLNIVITEPEYKTKIDILTRL